MKIHRIDTVNLNSLYGETRIDLDEVLQGESLFLISGPTGSGKSTLMDAISLAFFGRTPRLDGARDKKDQRPAAIMSRGTGACRAAVEFSKLEGGRRQHYRAIWSCQRARSAPGARIQDAVRSMEILQPDGSWEMLVSSKKAKDFTPVFSKVFEGFGVMDFNRSMLLAQGQFDAFLKASIEERAKILERLTDTSIYKQIGERAARIRGRHSEEIKALRTLVAAGGGLDSETLKELERAHAQHVQDLTRSQELHQRAKARVTWVQESLKFLQQIEEVKSDQALLMTRKNDAQSALALLGSHEQCEALQAFEQLDKLDRVLGEGHRIAKSMHELEQEAPRLGQDLQQAEERLKLKKREAAALGQQLELLRPRVQDQLDSSAAVERSTQRLHKTQEEQATLTSGLEELKNALEGAETELLAARQTAEEARHSIEAEPAQSSEALRQTLSHARERAMALQKTIVPVERARSSAESLAQSHQQIQAMRLQIHKENEALLPLEEALAQRIEQELQATNALDREQRIAQLVVHRSELVDGEACPLCGAPEHPWTHDEERTQADLLIHQIIEEAQRIKAQACQARSLAQTAFDEAKRGLGDQQAGLALLTQNHAKATAQQEGLDQTARQSLSGLGLAPDLALGALQEAGSEAQINAEKAQIQLDSQLAKEQGLKDSLAQVKTLEATRKGRQEMHRSQAERKEQLQTLLSQQKALASTDLQVDQQAREALSLAWSQAKALRPTLADAIPDSPATERLSALQAWNLDAQGALSEAQGARQEAHTLLEGHKSQLKLLETQSVENKETRSAEQAELTAVLAQLALADASALRERRLSPEPLREYRRLRLDLQTRSTHLDALLEERNAGLVAHTEARPQDLAEKPDLEQLQQESDRTQAGLTTAEQSHRMSTDSLRDHAKAEADLAGHRAKLEKAEDKARVWESLHQLIGVKEGGRFQQFAQALNLGKLLDKANVHLNRLSDRYLLISREVEGLPTLNFDLADLHQAGARVATRSLSGGERFLVSLALALGLSDFRAIQMPIETLLLDEGFGTLDSETLDLALSALSQLQADGRQVGIISHVAGLREQIPARIDVRRLGGGRSEVLTL